MVETETSTILEGPSKELTLKRGGPPPERFTLQYLTKPENLILLIHQTWDYTDQAFLQIVDDIGHRWARVILRTKALQGDLKAIDLYLRIVERERESRRESVPLDKVVSSVPFIQKPRNNQE